MFNRGKSNQESSKRTGWNGHSGCFPNPVVERIPYLCGKQREKELELVSDPFLVDYFTGSLWNDILSHSSGVFN